MLSASLLLIVACLAAGVLLRVSGRIEPSAATALNHYVIHLALPALILHKLPKVAIDWSLLWPLALPWLLLVFGALLVLWCGRKWQWSREVTGALLILVPISNSAFLGFPLVEAYWGSGALPAAVIYDQFGSFIALSTYGLWILAVYGHGEKPTIRSMLGRVFHFTPFLALLGSLPLFFWPLPAWFDVTLSRIADTLMPVILVAVGLQWRFELHTDWRAPLAVGLTIKLLLMPLVAFALTALAGVGGELRAVLVFEAGMPSMITAVALAIGAGLAPRLSLAMLGFGIPLGLVCVHLWSLLLRY